MTTTTIQEPVLFRCPCCEATLSIPVEQAGVTGPCPHCNHLVRSPERAVDSSASAQGKAERGGFSLMNILPFEKRLRWDADEKEWKNDRQLRIGQRDFWVGVASKIDTRKTGWAIAAVFVIFMGTVAYRDGYRSTAGPRAAAMERTSEFRMPEARAGEMGIEPAIRWMPSGGFVAERSKVQEP